MHKSLTLFLSIQVFSNLAFLLVMKVVVCSLCSDSVKTSWNDKMPVFWILAPHSFSILLLCIPPGPDHGDDDRVLPLYLHHPGNVPCLLMQIEFSHYRLSFWWIAANCQWGLALVHNINLVWQAGGIMESSTCCIVNSLIYWKVNRRRWEHKSIWD